MGVNRARRWAMGHFAGPGRYLGVSKWHPTEMRCFHVARIGIDGIHRQPCADSMRNAAVTLQL
jgi:hypothetical protein